VLIGSFFLSYGLGAECSILARSLHHGVNAAAFIRYFGGRKKRSFGISPAFGGFFSSVGIVAELEPARVIVGSM